jgi:hypothetical protein
MMEVDGLTQEVAAVTWFESLAVASRPLHRPPAETRSSFFSRLAICTPSAPRGKRASLRRRAIRELIKLS